MLIVGSLLTACVAVPGGWNGHRSGGVIIAPFLPSVVVLDVEPYYFYADFHYHYINGTWFYSKSRRGPWAELPRNRYPKEVRFKKRGRSHDRGHGHDQRDRDGDYENQRY